jgi:hypothetical protein
MWQDGGEYTGYVEWIEFLRHVAGYEREGRIDYTKWQPYADLALHAGMRIMHEKFCIVSDRPEFMHIETVNGRGRLHSLNGPAKRYRDGWSIYAVHGVRVSAQVIEAPETLTPEQIRTEQNAEVRRVMIERFGAARYAKELGAKVVHEDEYGKLLRADVGDTEPYCFVEVLNSTPEPDGTVKTYTLRVPPTIRTCREGLAWTFEMPEAEMYAPEVMT